LTAWFFWTLFSSSGKVQWITPPCFLGCRWAAVRLCKHVCAIEVPSKWPGGWVEHSGHDRVQLGQAVEIFWLGKAWELRWSLAPPMGFGYLGPWGWYQVCYHSVCNFLFVPAFTALSIDSMQSKNKDMWSRSALSSHRLIYPSPVQLY
jgi:hypothetical protein